MERIKIAQSYDPKWLEVNRPQPLVDNRIEKLIQDVIQGNITQDVSDQVYADFKTECEAWIRASRLNSLLGFEEFTRIDICIGCTQFIDNIYMKGPVQFLNGDYRYHERLQIGSKVDGTDTLIPNVPLIIAMPFPSTGDVHKDMSFILDKCIEKNIPVHIDAAWITCSKEIEFDFRHPAIKSFAISLSKGLGLGWNRIGLRWTKESENDAISIMNDFNMNNRALAIIGLHFIRNLPPDYLWKTHADHYFKICDDFGLVPTNSIYLALKDGQPVGVSPLIRYLENAST